MATFITLLDLVVALDAEFVNHETYKLDKNKLNERTQLWLFAEGFEYGANDIPAEVAFRAFKEEAAIAVINRFHVDDPVIETRDIARWFAKFSNVDFPSFEEVFRPTIDRFAEIIANMNNDKEDNSMEEVRICCMTGSIIPEGTGAEIDGKWYSDEALDANFTVCDRCGERVRNEDVTEIDGINWCESCRDHWAVQCAECGEWVRKGDAYYYEGDYYCQSCWQDNFTGCAICGDYHRNEDMYYIESEDEYVCEYCRENEFFECGHCGELHRNRDRVRVYTNENGGWEFWCDDCMQWNTWYCEECERTYSDDVDHNDDNICPRCSGSRFQDTGDIRTWLPPHKRMGYHFKPIPCFCATQKEMDADPDWEKHLIFGGKELEIDRLQKCYKEDEWSGKIVDALPHVYCKTDCSLDKGGSFSGIEIVTHPSTLAWEMEHKEEIAKCFQMLLDGGWISHDAGTCGLHVHVSLHALEDANPYAVHNMLVIFDKFWKKLVKFSRRTEGQLAQWAKRYAIARGEYKTIKNKAKRDCSRYMAVNLQNEHTVELRMFRGTLNVNTYFATLQLVDCIVKKCIELGTDYRALQMLSWSELVHSDYEELNAYLKERGLTEEDDDKSEVVADPVDPDWAPEIGQYVHIKGGTNFNAHEYYGWVRDAGHGWYNDEFIIEVDSNRIALPENDCAHSCGGFFSRNIGRYARANEMEPATEM